MGIQRKTGQTAGAEEELELGAAEDETPEPSGISRAQVIKALLAKIEQRLAEDVGKATLGDYIKLIQLQKEVEDESPREIRVMWVDSPLEPEGGD